MEIAVAPGRIEVLDEGPDSSRARRRRSSSASAAAAPGARGPSGTGLGLAIARELTRQWGGEVRLRNREGGGLARSSICAGGGAWSLRRPQMDRSSPSPAW